MAHVLQTSTNVFGTAIGAVSKTVVSVLKSVGDFFHIVLVARSRADQLELMNNLTDIELATKYGINRDQIVAYVFRDKMF
jgi:hypothetical protein